MNRPAALLLLALFISALAAGGLFDSKPKKRTSYNSTTSSNLTPDFIAVNSPSPGSFVGGRLNVSWRSSRKLSVEYSTSSGRSWAALGKPADANASWLVFDAGGIPDSTRIIIRIYDPQNRSFSTTLGGLTADNTPPFAYCANATAVEGGGANLSAAFSTDALSGIAAYEWTVKNASFETDPRQNITVKMRGKGSYLAKAALRVIDRGGNAATANCTVNVTNIAPQVTATASENATEGKPVNFTATAADPGSAFGENYSYYWDFGDGNYGSGRTASHTYAVTAPHNLYNASVFVDDGTDAGNASVQVNVTNARPVVSEFTHIELNDGLVVFKWEATHPPGITLYSHVDYYDNVTGRSPPTRWVSACTQYGKPYQCIWNMSTLGYGVIPYRLTVSDSIEEVIVYGNRNITRRLPGT